MHHVFQIAELVEIIVENLVVTGGYSSASVKGHHHNLNGLNTDSWEDIKALSLTSSVFREPCLDIAWRNQISLVPLLRSADLLEVIQKPRAWQITPLYKYRQCEGPLDVAKLLKYSSRIKNLNLGGHFVDASDEEEESVLKKLPSGVLFSGLRRLTCGRDIPSVLFVLRNLVPGRSLSQFHMTFQSEPLSHQVLSELSEDSSTLTEFQVERHWTATSEAKSTIRTILERAKRLETVRFLLKEGVDSTFWYTAAALSGLKHLVLPKTVFDTPPTPATFTSLTLLEVAVGPNIQTATSLLKNSRFPCLQYLTCSIHLPENTSHSHDEVLGFCEAIALACPVETLRNVRLWTCYNEDEVPDLPPVFGLTILPAALRPLLRFRNIKSMHIWMYGSWDLDDALLRDMAHAWPDLVTLELPTMEDNPQWPQQTRITFAGVAELALGCPHLQKLRTVLNSTPPPDTIPPRPPLDGKWQTSLKTLEVQDSYIEDSVAVAAYLSGVFPALETIGTHGEGFPDELQELHGSRWKLVQHLIPQMVAVRTEERTKVLP